MNTDIPCANPIEYSATLGSYSHIHQRFKFRKVKNGKTNPFRRKTYGDMKLQEDKFLKVYRNTGKVPPRGTKLRTPLKEGCKKSVYDATEKNGRFRGGKVRNRPESQR